MEKEWESQVNFPYQDIRRRKLKMNSAVSLNILYIPALVLFVVFLFYPFYRGILVSLTNWNGYSQTYKWIGIENYIRMYKDPVILTVVKNTLIYGFGSTVLQNIFGLLLALLLNHRMKIRSITRTFVYLPVIISPLIMGYIWYFFFQFDGGAINDIILLFTDKPLNLLGDSNINIWIITFVNTFQFTGIAMTIFLAGLQSIPKDYFEVSRIDGASSIEQFYHITLPMLAPSITINIVINLIGGLKLYDVIWALTGGGPGYASSSLSTMMYQLYFGRQDAGYAASLGILMFTIISIISLSALVGLRKKEVTM